MNGVAVAALPAIRIEMPRLRPSHSRVPSHSRARVASLPLLLSTLLASSSALAETDVFGVGDGHNGGHTAGGSDEVINSYAPIAADVAAGATEVTIGTVIGDGGAFATGDLILLWRPTGIDAAESTVASGNQQSAILGAYEGGAVGRWELARVQSVVSSTLTLTAPLVNAWKRDVTQVVKVPEYTTVSVPGATSLAAEPWQAVGSGYAGGILVFLATGAVTVTGAIHADGAGFRGGVGVNRTNVQLDCPNNDGAVQDGYAHKGESVVATVDQTGKYTQLFGTNIGGRGNRSIGAGGGNCVENGGGGGGNAGLGGAGGTSVLNSQRGGLGGAGLDYSLLQRLSMGGGGGAGEQKNSLGSGGAPGGGVIFFRAQALAGAGMIRANGQAAANAQLVGVESDGAGGGGAGGSVLIRLVTTANCGTIEAKGGAGGESHVVGLSVFGPGGGGSGGRVLLQAAAGGTCPIVLTAGAAGTSGGLSRGATPGADGRNEPLPTPGGNYCYSNPVADPQCPGPCNTATGFCHPCAGPFGGSEEPACAVSVEPVCMADGSCAPCNGDFGTGNSQECQLTASPYCFMTGGTQGACGKCTNDGDCAGPGHAGPECSPTFGACGTACNVDSDCKSTEWCHENVCVPKTPNGQPVPAVQPIAGECTEANGQRVCLAGVCEEEDDLCGKKNGSPCAGVDERCRSNICFPADRLCGKPTGQPCAENEECRSELCQDGLCAGCVEDSDCQTNQVCDKQNNQCVDGCREIGGQSNCEAGKVCSARDGTIGRCVDPAGDGGTDGGVAFDTSGLVEGGGCACRTSLPSGSSPFMLAGGALVGLLFARRRRGSHSSRSQ